MPLALRDHRHRIAAEAEYRRGTRCLHGRPDVEPQFRPLPTTDRESSSFAGTTFGRQSSRVEGVME
jgi:hypothetical protein